MPGLALLGELAVWAPVAVGWFSTAEAGLHSAIQLSTILSVSCCSLAVISASSRWHSPLSHQMAMSFFVKDLPELGDGRGLLVSRHASICAVVTVFFGVGDRLGACPSWR